MAGVTDLPFRRIVRELGDFFVFSEMVASNAVIRNVARTKKMMDLNGDSMTSVQIVGADPTVMADAAKLSQDLGAKFIDINMGCPVKKVVKSYAGSALMKDINSAAKIIEKVVNGVSIPVSLKTRLGWSNEKQNVVELAKIAEELGIKMITVHGRTRAQLFTGKADWKAVIHVKNAVKIPVIVNGDIRTESDVKASLLASNADGVMIGRAAMHAPWILAQMKNGVEFANIQKVNIIKRHLSYVKEFYNTDKAVVICKKVLMQYCINIKNAANLRKQIVTIDDFNKVNEATKQLEELYCL